MTDLINNKIRKLLAREFGMQEAIKSFSEPFKHQSLKITCRNNEIYVSDNLGNYSARILMNKDTFEWEAVNKSPWSAAITEFIEDMNQIADENWEVSYEDLISMNNSDKAKYMNKYLEFFTPAEHILFNSLK